MIAFTMIGMAIAAGFFWGGAYVGNHYDPDFGNPPRYFKWLNGYFHSKR
jgi:hypothetical protein